VVGPARKINLDGLHEELKLDGMTRILGPRRFHYDGPLVKVKNGHKLHAFLMSDMLLFAEEKTGLFKDYQYVLYRQPLALNAIIVRDVDKPAPDDTIFEIVDLASEVRGQGGGSVWRPGGACRAGRSPRAAHRAR